MVEILAVLLVLGVVLEVHDDVGADAVLFAHADGVAVRAGGLPFIRLLSSVLPRAHGDVLRDHERGIEAHAELTDDVDAGVLLLRSLLTELVRAGGGDHAEVVLKLLLVHADAVVGHGEAPCVLVDADLNAEVAAAEPHLVVREGQVAELVDRVRRVGNDLAQKDLELIIRSSRRLDSALNCFFAMKKHFLLKI